MTIDIFNVIVITYASQLSLCLCLSCYIYHKTINTLNDFFLIGIREKWRNFWTFFEFSKNRELEKGFRELGKGFRELVFP